MLERSARTSSAFDCSGLDHERGNVQMRRCRRSLEQRLLGRVDPDLQPFFLGR